MNKLIIVGIVLSFLTLENSAFAKDKKSESSQSSQSSSDQSTSSSPAGGTGSEEENPLGEKVNVEKIKEKYWARGQESELGVVQNRLYSKANKFEFGIFIGSVNSDPFMTTNNLGASLGYHFNEYLSVHALGFKDFWRASSAFQTLEQQGKTANINPAWSYLGAEARGSLLYGKLSLVGKKIIYFDLYVLGGAGATWTESGTNFTPHAGIGQQIFLSKEFTLGLDYRVMYYNETIIEKTILSKLGQNDGTRGNFSHVITLGINFYFGLFK